MVHEASLHESNSFVTLSYSEDKLPADRGLSKREFQLFMKRLRFSLGSDRIRFFGCGEYGSTGLRPHYHLIIFGHAFEADRVFLKQGRAGDALYRSPALDAVWGLGFAWIGAVTHESARYVARYTLKKAGHWQDPERYRRVNMDTGEVVYVEPEFLLMSRRPGLGSGWWDKYKSDCFPSDFVIIDGSKVPVPTFYRNRALREAGDSLVSPLHAVDKRRRDNAARHAGDQTTERRLARDEVMHRKVRSWDRECE